MKDLLKYTFLSVLALMVFSCTQSEDDPTLQELDKEKVQVSFTLSMEATNPTSRAGETWGDDYAPDFIGDEYDNQIDLNSLQVVLFDVDDKYVGKVQQLRYYKVENGPINEYTFVGDLSTEIASGTYSIMVFANCPEVTATTVADLKMMTFVYNPQRGIPMWGFIKQNINLVPGSRTVLNKIPVLRAMAKVEVSLNNNLVGDYSLLGVTLSRYKIGGYCLPQNYNATATSTGDLNIDTGFNPHAEAEVGTSLSFNELIENQKFCVYIPEYDNDAVPATMTLEVQHQDESAARTYTLDFRNIIRNHYYQYIITGVNENIEFELQYQVAAWIDVTNPTITFN
ncbi:MAG: hypothetical protein E7096_03430 [Bacteroides sp.]|nr:hypothetical protein [Bacteroides sp.]